jgi:hypothetical protein
VAERQRALAISTRRARRAIEPACPAHPTKPLAEGAAARPTGRYRSSRPHRADWFRETIRAFQETNGSFRETGRAFQETNDSFRETGRAFQETNGSFRETGRAFQETNGSFRETGRAFQETNDSFRETGRAFPEPASAIGPINPARCDAARRPATSHGRPGARAGLGGERGVWSVRSVLRRRRFEIGRAHSAVARFRPGTLTSRRARDR